MPDNTARRIDRLLTELASIIDQIGFEAAQDAISAWEGEVADDGDLPEWHAVFGAGMRHALDVAWDADDCADTCLIRLDWSDAGHSMTFRFDAAHGAGDTLGPVITSAVAKAIMGDFDHG
jgi:hypothetical protein